MTDYFRYNIISHFIVFIFLMNITFVFSQNQKKLIKQDSLLTILKATDSLELKSEIHYELYNINRRYNPELAMQFLQEELKLQKNNDNISKLALVNSQIGWCYIGELEQPEEAEIYLKRSLELAIKIKDSSRAGTALTFLGFMNQRKSHFKTAIDYYYKSLIYKKADNNHNRIGFTYNLIGETFNLQEQYDKSLEFHLKALNERKKTPNGHVAHSYQNIGKVYINTKEYNKAIDYFEKALKLRLKNNHNKHIAICYNGLGNANLHMDFVKKAIPYYNKSVMILDSIKAPYLQSVALKGLSKSYLKLKDYPKALNYAERVKTIAFKHNYRDHLKDDYKIFSDIYLAKNNNKKAFDYYKKHVTLKDSIINSKTLTQISELEGIYNTEKNEREIASLMAQNLNQKEQTEKQRNQRNLFLLISLSLTLLSLLSYLYFRKIQTKKKALEIALKDNKILLKETHHRVKNSFQIVSSLLYLQSENMNDKEAALAVKDAQNRVKSMALIHQKLYSKNNLIGINTEEYINDLVSDIINNQATGIENLEVSINAEKHNLSIDTITSIGLIINELITNVIKHAFPKKMESPHLSISFIKENETYKLTVNDNGIGFKRNLESKTFGLKLIDSLVKKLKANVVYNNDNGTKIVIVIHHFKEV